mgnify:FL=1|tara:strand:- start:4079 stop:4852 length:774 start_codon:yes stop_codon:yes gene_type:complete
MEGHFDIKPASPPPPEEELLEEEAVTGELTGEEEPNFIYPEVDEVDTIVEHVKNPKLSNEDVFTAKPVKKRKPKVKEVIKIITPEEVVQEEEQEVEEEEEEEVVIPVVEPVKKVKKKRKPMTPEHLAKLAVAREKAFAVKAKKKAERDEIRDLQTKVVNKKNKKIKDIIMENLDDDELPVHMRREVKEKVVPKNETMSKQQIAEAVALGVETYDAKRRAEKKTKKEAMAQQEKQNDNIRKISNAMNLGTNAWDAYLR